MEQRKHVHCCICDHPIYFADDMHDQDDCYEINDDIICDDCIRYYVTAKCRVELKEG